MFYVYVCEILKYPLITTFAVRFKDRDPVDGDPGMEGRDADFIGLTLLELAGELAALGLPILFGETVSFALRAGEAIGGELGARTDANCAETPLASAPVCVLMP
jgi:hypothetical protein